MQCVEIDNFSIQEESSGWRVLCNNFSIISEIPAKELSISLILELKKCSIDWNRFNGELWIPEQFEVHNAIETVKGKA